MASQTFTNDRARHDELSTDFQICIIDLLNRTLIENGIESLDRIRIKPKASFLFNVPIDLPKQGDSE